MGTRPPECDEWRVSNSGSIRVPQPMAKRRLKHITHKTGCAAHGWNMDVDQQPEQRNKRNERHVLIVEMFLGRATGRYTIDVLRLSLELTTGVYLEK